MRFKGLDKAMQSAKDRMKTTESNITTCTDHVVLRDVLPLTTNELAVVRVPCCSS